MNAAMARLIHILVQSNFLTLHTLLQEALKM